MNYIDTQNLRKYTVKAQDGEIGKVTDFYFDEDLFYLRYLVVDTGPFLLSNLVLVSPVSFHKVNPSSKTIDICTTKKELENSPSLESVETISRKYEKAYNDYFTWPYFWTTTGASAWAIGPYGLPWGYYNQLGRQTIPTEKKKKLTEGDARENGLRSAKELESYSIRGIDDDFGHIQGFILEPKTLSIDFIIVDTINYLPSKLVLLRPEWIEDISWHSETVKFPFSKEHIKSAPAYRNGELNEKLIEKTDKHFKKVLHDDDDDDGKLNTIPINEKGKNNSTFKVNRQRKKIANVSEEEKEEVGAVLDRAKSAMMCKGHETFHPGDHYLITAEVTEEMILDSLANSKTYLRSSGTKC